MEESTDNRIIQAVEIVLDGDVILVVGPEKTRLLVKSLLLMAASKPFSVMLGPNWKEGHNMRHSNGPFELFLPDDDATALEIICSVIHFQNDKIPQTLPASDVLAVAVAADKYDCLNALQFAYKAWIREPKEKSEDLILLTAAAYLFGDARAFKVATAALILHYHGSYLVLFGEELETIVPWKVFCMLEEGRGLAKLMAAEILISGVNYGDCYYTACGWNSLHGYSYLIKLEAENLWPRHLCDISISRALRMADTMADPTPPERSIPCNVSRWHRVPEYRLGRRWKLEEFHKSIGLCLECVRGGSRSSSCEEPSHSSHK